MAIGTMFFVVILAIAAIWIIIELKRAKHKFFAIFLIALILFTYFSFTFVLKKNDVSLDSTSGIFDASKLYFSWLGSMFGNFRTITANAIKMDWSGENKTIERD